MNKPVQPKTLSRSLPNWLKVGLPKGSNYFRLKDLTQKYNLNTVCESASCPNIASCWSAGTLTLMILGDTCTRACRFCDVPTGNLKDPKEEEPKEVAKMLSLLNLNYVVITSVDRDDLPDGGSHIWVETIQRVKKTCPDMKVEVLIPDFKGKVSTIEKLCRSQPHVLAHNLETVESMQFTIRPQCRYSWSLKTLETASKNNIITKSSLMLGLGEKREEVIKSMHHLISVNCQILSIGQYLRPSKQHLEVVEYIRPEIFEEYKIIGESLGLKHVEAGPLVRSSFHAERQANPMIDSFYQ